MDKDIKRFNAKYGDIIDIDDLNDILIELSDAGSTIEYRFYYTDINGEYNKPNLCFTKNIEVLSIAIKNFSINNIDNIKELYEPLSVLKKYFSKRGFDVNVSIGSSNYINLTINMGIIETNVDINFDVHRVLYLYYKNSTISNLNHSDVSIDGDIITFEVKSPDNMYINSMVVVDYIKSEISMAIIDEFTKSLNGLKVDIKDRSSHKYDVYHCDKLLFTIESTEVELPKFKVNIFKKVTNYKVIFTVKLNIDKK